MKNLTDIDSTFKFDKLIDQLESFVNIYSNWIEKQKKESNAEKLEVKYKESSKRLINKCEELKTRMLNGIKLLKHEEVLRSFLDANKAMFYQRVLSDFSKHREELVEYYLMMIKKMTISLILVKYHLIHFQIVSGIMVSLSLLAIIKTVNFT